MLEFLSQNIATIIISLVLAAVVGLIVAKLYKDKKAGKSSCGCKCSCCPNAGACHGGQPKKKS